MSVRHRELNPDTVAHLSTNRTLRRLTLSIEANALITAPDHHDDPVAVAYLLQVSDELFVAHQMLCSRLADQQQQLQQQHPSTDVSFLDGHLSNYQTLVSWCIDGVIQVGTVYLSVFTCAPGMLR